MTDPTHIPPALTPGQWADALSNSILGVPLADANPSRIGDYVDEDSRHACAAICLNGQTFGFTQEELAWLRHSAAPEGADCAVTDAEHAQVYAELAILSRVIAKIAALLPPETP